MMKGEQTLNQLLTEMDGLRVILALFLLLPQTARMCWMPPYCGLVGLTGKS